MTRRHRGAAPVSASPAVPHPITHHLLPITLVLLLCATLLLGGCAAGSPSVVAPVAPDSSAEDLVPAVEAAPDPAAQAAAPEPVAPSAEIQPVVVDTAAEVAETLDPTAPEILSSTDTAAFAQDVPAGAASGSQPALGGEDA
jgi:hypothetical protein